MSDWNLTDDELQAIVNDPHNWHGGPARALARLVLRERERATTALAETKSLLAVVGCNRDQAEALVLGFEDQIRGFQEWLESSESRRLIAEAALARVEELVDDPNACHRCPMPSGAMCITCQVRAAIAGKSS